MTLVAAIAACGIAIGTILSCMHVGETWAQTGESEPPAVGRDSVSDQPEKPSFRFANASDLGYTLFANAGGGAETNANSWRGAGHLELGAEFRIEAPSCDLLALGGQVRLTRERVSDGVSAQQWARICLLVNSRVMETELTHHLEWDVVPPLSARRYLRAARNRRETITLSIAPVRLPIDFLNSQPSTGSKGDVIIFALRIQPTFLWSTVHALDVEMAVEIAPFRYLRYDESSLGDRFWMLEVLPVGLDAMGDATVMSIGLLRLTDIPLGSDAVLGSGYIGIDYATGGPFINEFERQMEFYEASYRLSLEAVIEQFEGAMALTRDTWPMFDGSAVLEHRLEASIAGSYHQHRWQARGFVADTVVRTPSEVTTGGLATDQAPTGGLALHWRRAVIDQLDVEVGVEVARSFYTNPSDDAPLTSSWGVRVFAGLSTVLGRSRQ